MLKIVKWHNAAKKLPKKTGEYLVYTQNGRMANMPYSSVHKKFNAFDDDGAPKAEKYGIAVKYWAKLPKFPTEESEGVQ